MVRQVSSSLHGQQGFSYWGWLFIVLAFGFILTVVSKLGPAYIDAYYVDQGLKELAEREDIREMSHADITRELSKFFTLNNVRGEPAKAVKVIRGADSVLVSVDYELRQPFIHNVDVVMRFNKQLNTDKAELCCEPLVDLEQFRNSD